MLGDASVHVTLPVSDLERAKKFYGEVLGLKNVAEFPGGVQYESGGNDVFVYESQNAGTNQGTAASWKVDEPEATVESLRQKGVTFEHYDEMPGVTREGDIHSMGEMKAAWFKDPDGNILCVGNAM